MGRSLIKREVRRLDPAGRLDLVFDREVGRWAVAYRPPRGPRGRLDKTLMHISGDSGCGAGYWKRLLDDNPHAEKKCDAGEWVACPSCGEIHGDYEPPTIDVVDKLIDQFPALCPGGVVEFLAKRSVDRIKRRKGEAAKIFDRSAEHVSEAAWHLHKMSDDFTSNIATKEDRIEQAARMERNRDRRIAELETE